MALFGLVLSYQFSRDAIKAPVTVPGGLLGAGGPSTTTVSRKGGAMTLVSHWTCSRLPCCLVTRPGPPAPPSNQGTWLPLPQSPKLVPDQLLEEGVPLEASSTAAGGAAPRGKVPGPIAAAAATTVRDRGEIVAAASSGGDHGATTVSPRDAGASSSDGSSLHSEEVLTLWEVRERS